MGQLNIDRCARPFNCLIADDSEFARKNIATVVSMLGGNVVAEAANGQEAVELYCRLNPDLVLLDITMPVLDGVDTLRRIIERNKNAKVIIVSSVGHKEMVWKAICLGARYFVTKPFSPDYVGTIIRSVIEDGKEV